MENPPPENQPIIKILGLVLITIILAESFAISVLNNTIGELNYQLNEYQNAELNNTTTTTTTNTNYQQLQREYEIEKALHIDNSLASYYDTLRQSLGPTGTWNTVSQSEWKTAANFAAKLALHDQAKLYWTTLESNYHTTTGKYSYNTAKEMIETIYGFMEITSTDSTLLKMEKILTFINSYIMYRPEVNDRFHSPVETLAYKSGDCDDFTCLAAAYFDMIGLETAIGLFSNSTMGGHAMLLVKLNDLGTNKYWFFNDLTQMGLPTGKWLIIEPQSTIDIQGTAWQSYWTLKAAGYVDVNTQIS